MAHRARHRFKIAIKANPLIIREGSAGLVELAILGDGGYMHIVSVPKTLVTKVPNK